MKFLKILSDLEVFYCLTYAVGNWPFIFNFTTFSLNWNRNFKFLAELKSFGLRLSAGVLILKAGTRLLRQNMFKSCPKAGLANSAQH